jgi:cell division septum initiation protein DivIVA
MGWTRHEVVIEEEKQVEEGFGSSTVTVSQPVTTNDNAVSKVRTASSISSPRSNKHIRAQEKQVWALADALADRFGIPSSVLGTSTTVSPIQSLNQSALTTTTVMTLEDENRKLRKRKADMEQCENLLKILGNSTQCSILGEAWVQKATEEACRLSSVYWLLILSIVDI